MSVLTPTDEQQAVIDAAKAGGKSLMVEADAGCAKTTTLKMLGKVLRGGVLGIAFNKSTAKELSGVMPGNFVIKTANGLGHGAWIRANPGVSHWELDEKKLGKLVTEVSKESGLKLTSEQWDNVRQLTTRAMQEGLVPGGEGRPLMPDTPEAWMDLADDLWIPDNEQENTANLARAVLIKSIALARQGVISFDDQIYCSVCLGGKFTQFEDVIVDEAQDLNKLNHEMIRMSSRVAGRIIAVGDPKQCHPPGTMIQLTGGKSKPIEEINIDDKLVSFNRKSGFSGIWTQGRAVTNVASFPFSGELVKINTDSVFSHECTPNHRCLVKWTDKRCYVVYLMQKGNQFRIGKAQSWYTSKTAGGFGPAMRARQENADALWVLCAFDTKEEAELEEKIIWTQFGLPDLIFKCSGAASSTQRHLDLAWDAIGDNSARAKICLKKFRREYDFPMWKKGDDLHIGEKKFIIEACNLIDGVMSVKVFDGTANCDTWLICRINHVPYTGMVYGLTVESNGFGQHLYLANGIVTHNSIYAFRGAVTGSMGKLRLLKPTDSWIDLPLHLTFRCPKVIVKKQQHHAPGFKAWHLNPEGAVELLPRTAPRREFDSEGMFKSTWSWKELEALLPAEQASIAILCRNNAPLMKMAFKLLRRRIGVNMLGRALGKNLVALSRKIVKDDKSGKDICAGSIQEWRERELAAARAAGKDHKLDEIYDRAACLEAVLDDAEVRDAGEMRAMLSQLFEREAGRVTLGTGHKAKGLEWDCVVHLDPWRIGGKAARTALAEGDPVPMEQERNLHYVVDTRTRHTLVEVSLEQFGGVG